MKDVVRLAATTETASFEGYQKILFLGKQGVGKTSIIQRLVSTKAEVPSHSTLGISLHNLELEYQGNKFYIQLWDVSNTLEDQITDFFRNVSLFILVYDYTDRDSFPDIHQFFEAIKAYNATIPVLLVGNKAKDTKQKVPKKISDLTDIYKLKSYPIAVKDYDGLSVLLQAIVQSIPISKDKK
jgi:small GTP-binding protein